MACFQTYSIFTLLVIHQDCEEILQERLNKYAYRSHINFIYAIDPDRSGGENLFKVQCQFPKKKYGITNVSTTR